MLRIVGGSVRGFRAGAPALGARYDSIVGEAAKVVPELTPKQVHDAMQQGDDLLLVDVREASEFSQAHVGVPVVHLSKGVLEGNIERLEPNADRKIVLYCAGGFRSLLAGDNLRRMGYTNVYSMSQGFRGWAEAGFPTSKRS